MVTQDGKPAQTIMSVVAETYLPFLERAKKHEEALSKIVENCGRCFCVITLNTCTYCIAKEALEFKG